MLIRSKLVVLRLDGDLLQQGFAVTLSIWEEGEAGGATYTVPPSIEVTGYLPPNPDLATSLQHHWQEQYRSIGAPYYRIKPKEIVYDGSINKHLEQIKACHNSAVQLRDRLLSWLDSESFRPIDKRLREELNREEPIRLLIRSDNQQLQKLPWHLWDIFERYPNAEVALSPTDIRRINTPTLKSKVKILAILGHSEGIDIQADQQLLKNLPNAETTFLVEKTRQEINNQLWEQAWDIIFFAGHSETEGETGRIYINKTDSLTIDELGYALKRAVEQGLKLAIFNSCDGLGLARRLNDAYIPQIIVMREIVPDQVAQEFLKYFLTAFSRGKSFYLAVREAREQLQGLESQFPCASWLPIIYQNYAQQPPTWPELRSIQVKRWRHSCLTVLLVSAVVSGLTMGMRSLGLLQPLELKSFDQMMQLRPAEKPDPRLLIVEVTQEDIDKLGGQAREYPLQDKTLLQLLKQLQKYQPQVIGLDIFRDQPVGEGYADLIAYLHKNQAQSAAARVIPVCIVPSRQLPTGIASPKDISEVGFGDVVRDPDGIFRRHLLAMEPPAASPCSTYYSLSFQLVLDYLKSKGISPNYISENYYQLGQVGLRRLQNHTGFYQQKVGLEGFQILLNYRSNQSPKDIAEHVTLTDVLTNRVDPERVKNKIILIGVTDPSIEDNKSTPYNQEIRGLYLHAQMVSQILSAVEERRNLLWFLPFWSDILWVWACSIVGGIVAWQFLSSPLRSGVGGGVAVIGLKGIYFMFLLTTGSLLPLIPSEIALLITGVSIVGYKVFKAKQI